MLILCRTIAALIWLAIWGPACALHAHEGHQPLPSKGVAVNTLNGRITLSRQAREAIGLETEEVITGEVASKLQVYAESVAPWQARAFGSAQISGQIEKLLVRPGDFVAKGQIVAELTSRELESVKLEHQQAQRDLSLNQQLLAMTEPTAAAGAVPMQRLLDLQNAVEQAENRLNVAQIRARVLGVNLETLPLGEVNDLYYQIRSPINGRVIHSDLAEGQFVEALEHLFEIVNLDQSWVRMQILEKDAAKIGIGNPVRLEFQDTSITIDGHIDRIDAALAPQSHVIWAWMTIDHPSIVPGMVGRATVRTSTDTEKLTVPLRSVYSDGLQTYVFVEEASTRASSEYRKKNIKLGTRSLLRDTASMPMVEVIDGEIYPGDRVVIQGGHPLSSLFFLGVLKLSDVNQRRLGMIVSPAAHVKIAKTIQLPASVVLPPESRSILASQLQGTVHSHSLTPGRTVRAGELLMEIASPDFLRLQLDFLSTSLDADLARRRTERIEEIKGDAVSKRIALEARAVAEQLELQSRSLRRELGMLGLHESEITSIVNHRKIIEHLPLRATMDGRVVSSTLSLGETVVASQPLVEIHNLDSIWIEAHVPLTAIGLIPDSPTGTTYALSQPDFRIPVVLSRIGPIVDEETRTQQVWLSLQSSSDRPLLRAGTLMSVDLRLDIGASTLAIPASAVVRDGLHLFAFVMQQGGYIQRRRIKTGRSDGLFIEILAGIEVGESVVSVGSRDLQTAFASLR